ncbi:YjbE family putative metal transport protein [Vogesella sp. LIG4]|uniref:YjbE family putative metal transport protein n=1 Tax=Vogesella sp. LIG4 TaxID=1192162 RepID=UPI00081F8639|nr:YjbE family putative metal transport protein [Vogesella sp. LIG4]SCK26133.1 integral membrane protein, YjbE family [Vogesella sp. LIG4]
MEFDSLTHSLGMAAQVFLFDLLLSGDNALVIAMACRSLPPALRRRAVLLGTGFAILLRVLLTTLASFLLAIPMLKLVGAALLLLIAIKLLLADDGGDGEQLRPAGDQLWSAVMVVVTADLILSLDNVVALAAMTQGSVLMLILGLLFSMPILMYGSLFVTRLLESYPLLLPAGSALLGWLAGQLAVSDPLLAGWVDSQAPALSFVVPLLCVVFVLCESRIIRQQAQQLVPPPALGLFAGLAQRFAAWGEAENDEPAVLAAAVAAPGSEPELISAGTVAAVASASVEPVPVALAAAATLAASPPPAALQLASEEDIAAPGEGDAADAPARKEERWIRVFAWLAVCVGVLGLGWIGVNLLTNGFMPKPAHGMQPQLSRQK